MADADDFHAAVEEDIVGADDDGFDDEMERLMEEGLEEATSSMKRETAAKVYRQHPECIIDYQENVYPSVPLAQVPPSKDQQHRSYPFLTKFEKTKILGFRMNQLSQGARPFIDVPKHVSDVRDIARLELEQKRLPIIVKRPMPDGTFEYWRLQDLLQLD
jgi:DNA-directed RNA polymerase subunit K/omega